MHPITATTQWVKGEVLQGRIMFGFAILMIFSFLYFTDLQESFHRGMAWPFALLMLFLLGYGGFQMTMRPKHIEKVAQEVHNNPKVALKTELDKAQKDDLIYSRLKVIWVVSFFFSAILYFVLKSDLWQGMSLGFAGFFLAAFIIDSFLHHRLKTYLEALRILTPID
ncbi:hypothetical protein P872_07415 [Rhodonellum psychrophilum GCM71 = DSM 17998]|uniref:Uncharacterized protein n=2 Tax=Rhodonellum TaxID=336827 RepID=U5BZ85_9BACT|nr:MULTISPECIES: hypothetical protein [Rhodonellum]ERM81976.1 hypothetical protein P872_07415 [Rhodonellum psychrophilum GCM71 = DSM 17998]SDZ31667.1 hypothetical protein SAMN05444412_11030 [Rhodonellum ikkaensis]